MRLARLALDLGYSGHSHFTDVFRRELGRTPSSVRALLSEPGRSQRPSWAGPDRRD